MRSFTALTAAVLLLGAWMVWHSNGPVPDPRIDLAAAQSADGGDGPSGSARSIGPPAATPTTRTAAVEVACVVKHLPSGAPASGALRVGDTFFPLKDGRCILPSDTLTRLDREPPLLAPQPVPALAGRVGDAQRPLPLRVVQATPTQIELCAPDGWFFTATLSGRDLAHAQVWISAASDTARSSGSARDATPQPRPADESNADVPDDLTVDARSFVSAELIGDRLPPTWIDDADAFVLAVVGPGGALQEAVGRPAAPFGLLVDLGLFDVPAAPGLRIAVLGDTEKNTPSDGRRAGEENGSFFELDYARVPDPTAPSFDAALALRQARPDLADFILGAGRMKIASGSPLLLSPLPADPRAQLTLIAPSGLRAPPVRIELQPGVVTDVVLDLSVLFPAGTDGVSLHGAVHWQHDGTPLSGGRVELSRTSRSVALDHEGRFSLGDVPAGSRAALRLVEFDPQAPDRIERLRVDVLATDQELRWEVLPSSVIHARGLRVGAPPLAFALQRYDGDRGFVSTTLESAVPTTDGVDIRAKAGDVYRVIACWSGVFQQMTGPVELSQNGADATTVFDPLLAARFLTGQFVDRSGAPIPNATVEVTGSIGALPPIVVQADGSGRFSVGPVNATEVSLIAYTDTAHGEATVTPDDLDQVEIVAD